MHISHKPALAALAALGLAMSTANATEFNSEYDFIDGSLIFSILDNNQNTIEVFSYMGCGSDQRIIVPEHVTHEGKTYTVISIGKEAFAAYSHESEYQLKYIDLPQSIQTIKDGAFNMCGALEYIAFPEQITEIAANVCSNCKSLTEVIFPPKLTKIRLGAFYGCEKLKSIILPETVDSIEASAFRQCVSLTSVTLPSYIRYIHPTAFQQNWELSDFDMRGYVNYYVENGILFSTNGSIDMYPNGKKQSQYTIPSDVTLIEYGAFAHNHYLESITIPNSIERIGPYAFYDCSSLCDIRIPESVTEIECHAFYGNDTISWFGEYGTSLNSLVIPASVNHLGKFALRNFKSLQVLNPEPPILFERPGRGAPEGGYTPIIQCDTLFVPNASVEKYKAAENIDFKQIFCVEPLEGIRFASDNIALLESETDSLVIENEPKYALRPAVKWSISDPSVATISHDGKITAMGAGTATVTATCGEFTASCQVKVSKAVENIAIGAIIGEVGEYIRLRSDVDPDDTLDAEITWKSTDGDVASVDETGLVRFLSAGSASVTAECQGHTASILFEVVNVDATGLRVFPTEIKGKAGDSHYLLALHEPSNTTDKTLAWSSSDESVATVDDNGYVSLHAPGKATVTAAGGAHTATCAVSVDASTALTAVGADGLTIEYLPEGIRLLNVPDMAKIIVTDIAGITVDATIARQPDITIPLRSGVYLVTVGTTTAKILIR